MASNPYKQKVVSQEELDAAKTILALGMTSPATQLYKEASSSKALPGDKENAGNSPDSEDPNWFLEVDKSEDDRNPVAGAPPGPNALSPAQDNNFKMHNLRSKRMARAAQPYSIPNRPAEGFN
ncbi:uncharacterized protein [Drosophila kikkawai]|uniref:Uncharacterized protein n=1 Tax=Drosophila kikkawai TaxID=30033 RepID=A0ABM3C587_DROKI|nr:uncharacterized protein LOC121502141 [Drosophila kikkawai]